MGKGLTLGENILRYPILSNSQLKLIKFTRLSLVIISLLFACGGIISPPKNFVAQASRYHQALNQRYKQVKSLSGELSVELWDKGKRVVVRQLFASQAPLRLRLDTLTPFEQPIATVIYNDQLLALHDHEAQRFIMGEANRSNFERLTRLRLQPSEMSDLLSGQLPRITSSGGQVHWDSHKGRSVLTLHKNQRKQIVTFDESNLSPRMTELYEDEKLLVRVRLADYTKQDPKLPRRLKIEIPHRSIVLNITLIDFTINPNLPQIAFEIQPPTGLSIESF
ncbi:MAG: hypothetical protein CL916_06375 [Deltaproteobacteria bacterium]|nr:hypothetical protein [Deltaproteobacteria bacterium]